MRELGAALAELAGRAAGVTSVDADASTEYRRGSIAFAAFDGQAIELRLHPEIADAARRTPDTAGSERGPEWVRFAPRTLDGHARDRLEAWFLSAWRAAAEG